VERQLFIFGDSITYGAFDREGGWVTRLRKYLDGRTIDSEEKESYLIYNLGVSGDNTDDLLTRFNPEINARLDKDEETIIVFAIGINDSQYVNEKENYRVSPLDFKRNLEILYKSATQYTSKIIFIGPTNVDESKTTPIKWANDRYYDNKSIKKYGTIIQGFCKEVSAPFLDMQGVLQSYDLSDGLHPNTEGFKKMFEQIKSFLADYKII
jgi:lysophospholipase L1-like esterase